MSCSHDWYRDGAAVGDDDLCLLCGVRRSAVPVDGSKTGPEGAARCACGDHGDDWWIDQRDEVACARCRQIVKPAVPIDGDERRTYLSAGDRIVIDGKTYEVQYGREQSPYIVVGSGTGEKCFVDDLISLGVTYSRLPSIPAVPDRDSLTEEERQRLTATITAVFLAHRPQYNVVGNYNCSCSDDGKTAQGYRPDWRSLEQHAQQHFAKAAVDAVLAVLYPNKETNG